MELRVKRIRPGEFSIHSETGALVSNAEHRETRYQGDKIVTHVAIVTREEDLGKFIKASPEAKEPKAAPKKKTTEEESHGSDSSPA